MTPKKRENFLKNLPLLFDIISCKCKILPCTPITSYLCPGTVSCTGFHVACSCPKDHRIPDVEVSFIKDQRDKVGTFGGKQVLRGIDKKATVKLQEKDIRKEKKKI